MRFGVRLDEDDDSDGSTDFGSSSSSSHVDWQQVHRRYSSSDNGADSWQWVEPTRPVPRVSPFSIRVADRARFRPAESSPDSSEDGSDSDQSDDDEHTRTCIRRPSPSHDAVEPRERRSDVFRACLDLAHQRRRVFEGIHRNALTGVSASQGSQVDRMLDHLGTLLADIDLRRTEAERQTRQEFESRERKRSQDFHRLISAIEKRDQDAALQAQRVKQEEAAAKAALARQQAEAEERIAKAKQAEAENQAKAREAEQSRQQQSPEPPPATAVPKPPTPPPSRPSGSPLAAQQYARWAKVMAHVKGSILPRIAADDRLNGPCRNAKRRITPKVGQVTNDERQISNVITDLGAILGSARSGGDLAHAWLLNHLSKALIKQSETEVTATLRSVFPLGRIVVGLLPNNPELADILMARLVKKCFLVSGFLPPRGRDEAEEDYAKRLGRRPGSAEDEIQYSNRIAGIVALYASIVRAAASAGPALASPNAIPSQFRPGAIWSLWVALISPPLAGLSATPQALATLLEVCGAVMGAAMGTQWQKLMRMTLDEGIRRQKARFPATMRPSVVKLESLLERLEAGLSLQ